MMQIANMLPVKEQTRHGKPLNSKESFDMNLSRTSAGIVSNLPLPGCLKKKKKKNAT